MCPVRIVKCAAMIVKSTRLPPEFIDIIEAGDFTIYYAVNMRRKEGGEYRMLNIDIIRAAINEDYDAMMCILSYYDSYITALSYVTTLDEKGVPVRYMDAEIKESIRAKLLAKIIDFDLEGALNKR